MLFNLLVGEIASQRPSYELGRKVFDCGYCIGKYDINASPTTPSLAWAMVTDAMIAMSVAPTIFRIALK